jgi:hypothetical protein
MATAPFNFSCNTQEAFDPVSIPDPLLYGYVTALSLDLSQPSTFKTDLTVNVPADWPIELTELTELIELTDTGKAAMNVVGVMASFSWAGGAADPLHIQMSVSQETAAQLKTLQQAALETIRVSALDYVIVDYDQETNQWYAQAAPGGQSLSGVVAGNDNSGLSVGVALGQVNGIDLNACSIQIAPPANQAYTLIFAGTPTERVAKDWGAVIGSMGTTAAGIEGAS